MTEDGLVAITLHGDDLETPESELTFTVTSLPAEGILKSGGVPIEVGTTFTGPPTLTYEPGAAREGEGTDSFTFTVTDSEGHVSDPATVAIMILKAVDDGQVTVDGDAIVRIGGTSGDDAILVTHTADGQFLQVTINGTIVSDNIALANVNEVRAWSRAGNDRVELVDLALTSMLHGGEGNDLLTGGAGDDLIFGGVGDDHLTGAAGNDFLVGGGGSDRIVGSAGHDVLVAGDVAHCFTRAALREISAAWAASKKVGDTVDDGLDEAVIDDAFDQLTGGSGADWFIVSKGDKVTDFKTQKKDGDVLTENWRGMRNLTTDPASVEG